jgi:PIN domain nuclease of toxin-antitoxin system
LPKPVADRIERAAASSDAVFIAAITLWEVAMLAAYGRLETPTPIDQWLMSALKLPGIGVAELSADVAVEAYRLPGQFHGDPADRLIVATARQLGAVLVTADAAVLAWAKPGHIRRLAAK